MSYGDCYDYHKQKSAKARANDLVRWIAEYKIDTDSSILPELEVIYAILTNIHHFAGKIMHEQAIAKAMK